MPKIIDGLQSRIMEAARARLFAVPPSFSLRAVAADCSIAVGTIYNYFPDKETLIASVFAQDWIGILQETETACLSAERIEEGLYAVYSGLVRFTQSHEAIWRDFPVSAGTGTWYRKGHTLLLSQIESLLNRLFTKFGKTPDSAQLTLTAELLITASQHPELKEEEIMRVLQRQI